MPPTTELPTPALEALMRLVQAAADATENAQILRGLAYDGISEAGVLDIDDVPADDDAIFMAADDLADLVNARHETAQAERVAS